MKPTNNSSETTPKSSLSKSLKKSSKSRSRLSKSAVQNVAPVQVNHSEAHNQSTSASADASRDKVKEPHSRIFAGFGAKSVKVIWEQHDTSDTEVMSEVYPRLAEDLTYKMWELVNNIKTYARHSGGNVTCDLVNEVLKDSDVPPVLGSGDTDWDKIEYDGNFFFNTDKILLLRDEYLKESQTSTVVSPEITSSWVMDRKYSKNLLEFVSCLCNALFLGDEESYNYAIETAAFAPQIGCAFKILLRKCIEMLAFEQKIETIERCLRFLRALSFNPYSRDVECREQLFHLSEIMICMLIDTLDSIKPPPIIERKEESFELVKNFLENSDQEIKKEVENLNQMDVDDIRSEYEALFQMMERDGFQERDNNEAPSVEEIKVTPPVLEEKMDIEIKPDVVGPIAESREIIKQEVKVKLEPVKLKFSPYQAEMLEYKNIEMLCNTIGCLGAQFGYFQNECTFLLQKRLEKFFDMRLSIQQTDYEFISRCIKGLLVLGEFAFREFIPFMHKVDPQECPEWVCNDFAPGAIFLSGKDDIFLYEWLEDLCGHKLQPYMLYYYKYHQTLTTKHYNCQRNSTFKIYPKVVLKTLNKHLQKTISYEEAFPDAIPLKKPSRKIGFLFAGCQPVPLKQKKFKNEIKFEKYPLINFQSKIVVGKRRLLKTLSDERRIVSVSNFCYLSI